MAPPPTTGGLKKLEVLDLGHTQITDAGCAALTAALNNSGALPALETLTLEEIPASGAAKEAVQSALTWLPNVLPRVRRRVRV